MFAVKPFSAIALASLVLATACTTASETPKTRDGAVIGGLIGGLAGAIAGNDPEERRRNAAVGAIVGAGVGGVIGSQLDKQEAALRQDLGNDNVTIVNTGDRLIVTLPQDILFATDSTTVRADLQSDLRALAGNLNEYPNTTVQVIGHTDSDGSAAYNQDLSQRRAQAVSSVLIGNGVSPSRIQAFGRGEDQPVATNLTAEGKAQNRRVEIVILPNAA
ncbi:OmpA family protein [Mesobacterium pallidum]|uniref:OmpA family protein n=1 Tax=Mesobacterium pallidum TaxID=2872037 RepID=UPI001EE24300|nr:OmpA family protein [Mesobacterium pallidum]